MRFSTIIGRFIILVSFCIVLTGCGENRGLVAISGIITCDGKEPPAAGSIIFMPEQGQPDAQQGKAVFDKGGKFVASTWETGDGLRPGKYKVRIECWEAAPSFSGSAGISLIDRKYTDWKNDAAMPRLEVVLRAPKADVVFDVSAATEAAIRAERTAHQSAEADAPKTMLVPTR